MKLKLFIAIALVICSCSSFGKLKNDEAMQYIRFPGTSLRNCKVIGCTNDRIYLENTQYNMISTKYHVYVYWVPKSEFNKKELKLIKETLDQRKLYDSTSSEGCNCNF